MRKNTNKSFINFYPTLDLHGEYSTHIDYLIKDFIRDQIKLKSSRITIVHGIGYGILRKETHRILKKMPEVKSFSLDFWNLGSTTVDLNLDSK